MTKDYAKGKTKRRKSSGRKQRSESRGLRIVNVTNLLWLTIGLLLGLFLAMKIYQSQTGTQLNLVEAMTDSVDKASTNKSTSLISETAKPTFDFYTILPNQKTTLDPVVAQPNKPDIVKQQTVEKKQVKESPAKAVVVDKSLNKFYVLQIASFKQFADADRLKAELALRGFPVTVSEGKRNNQRFYRVRLGPYPSMKIAAAKQQELQQQHVNSVLYKVG